MELTFGIPDWPSGRQIPAEELVERLKHRFPAMLVDREKGNAFVQQQLDELAAMRVPDMIVRSHRGCFGKTIYVSISDLNWLGGTASSYLTSIQNPALQGVTFVVTGIAEESTIKRITQELASALDMVLCSEINWDTGGCLSEESVHEHAESGAAPDRRGT